LACTAIDESKVKLEQFRPNLEIARKNATLDGICTHCLPRGTDGSSPTAIRRNVSDYTDVCRPDLKGRTSFRLRRPILMASLCDGQDPFALYDDPSLCALMEQLATSWPPARATWLLLRQQGSAAQRYARRRTRVADMWTRRLDAQSRESGHRLMSCPSLAHSVGSTPLHFPRAAATMPAAYAWINFTMRPEIAARITRNVGNWTAARGTETWSIRECAHNSMPAFRAVPLRASTGTRHSSGLERSKAVSSTASSRAVMRTPQPPMSTLP